MRIDMAIEGKANVHQVLDRLQPVALDVAVDTQRVGYSIVDHVAIGWGEQLVVLEKIDMTKHMGSHEQVGNFWVGIQQKGQARVTVEDDLIDFRQAHSPIEPLALVYLAVGPMPRPRWQTIGSNFGHNVLRHDFE